MKTLSTNTVPSSVSVSITSNTQPSLVVQPDVRATDMTTEQLCQWLRTRKVKEKYIECFEREDIDGSVLADYKEEHLEGIGISEAHVRVKIIAQFKKLIKSNC